MLCVRAEELGFAYSDRAPILREVRFHLSRGWYGLVGANGAGKTTLARLIAGGLRPTTGRIVVEPPDATILVCEQEIEQVSPDLESFALDEGGRSRRERGLLGLDPAALGRWPSLSPGERKRWQLATALARDPDVLIVDEPTNHLDADARAVIARSLGRFSGIGVVVSHDRELLDQLTRATLRLHRGTLQLFPASYARARRLWESSVEQAQMEREALIERRSRLERRIAAGAREQHAAEKNRSAGHRMRNPHDHDARSLQAGGRAERGEGRIGRRVTVMSGELARLERAIPEFAVDKSLGRSLFVGYEAAPRPRVLALDGVTLTAGSRLLLGDVHVVLGREERIRLVGPNGAGKSTLLRALLERAASPRDRLLYLPQEMDRGEIRALRSGVEQLSRVERGRILGLLAALGVDPERVLASPEPSPGEARKLKMALGMAAHAWAMVLDEPTNHLDLPSIERLELALAAFPGALLIVSHDARFAAGLTRGLWEIRDQKLLF